MTSRAERHVVVPVERLQYIRDLLTEKVYGSSARSPGHNARLVVDDLLSAAPPVQMEAVIERDEAERIVDALFKDLRDRKFLKWLFSEDPEAMGPILHDSHGQPLNALSADVQDEIRETWIGILLSKPDDMKEGAPEPFVTTEEYNATYGSDPIKEPPA